MIRRLRIAGTAGSLMLWLTPALTNAAPENSEWRLMPPEDRTAPPQAVDHDADLVTASGHSVYRRERVIRSGDWIRSDRTEHERTTTHFSHLGSAASFSYSRGADGRIEAIRVARDRSDTPYYRMHRAPTGRSSHLLGQACLEWRIETVSDLAGDIEWLSCKTADGIQLRIREQIRATGVILTDSRAVAVSRHRVEPADARPPADFFDIAALRDGPAWREPGPDYRVVLRAGSVDGGGPGSLIIQRRGALRSYDAQNDDGSRNYAVNQGTFHISYWQEPGGRPTALWVNRLPDDDIADIPAGTRVRVEGREPETILGESCTWTRSTTEISHYREMDCETAEGIILARDEQSYAGHNLYRATSLSRDRLSPVDFRLPDRALNLSGWGVAPD